MTLFRKLFVSAAAGLAVGLVSLYWPVSESSLSSQNLVSFRILDRHGHVLREVLSGQSGSCRMLQREQIPPEVIITTLTAEDKFFYIHPGVNVFSISRALWRNITQGRIVSGASTITQQLARNIHARPSRTILSKIQETWTALRLEKTFTKDWILTQYLNRIYYGNRAYGIEAASQTYFGKPCRDLTLAEAAYLAALPRSPGRFHSYLEDPRIIKAQKQILTKVFQAGHIRKSAYRRALRQILKLEPVRERFLAPHFCDFVLANAGSADRTSGRDIRTTLDYELHQDIQHLLREHINSLAPHNITQGAAVVIDNSSGEIISMVGSRDFFDDYHQGQVNGAVSLRQPGSALKPFTYGLALQQGMSAAEILFDQAMEYSTPTGPYQPVNFDHKFHGPVRLRQALACSYNIPAVRLTERLGAERLYLKLKQAGFTSFTRPSSHYGVGLTLGNGEVTLLELTQAYSSLSRDGHFQPVKWRLDSPANKPKERSGVPVFTPETAYILTHILSDPDARIPAFGYRSPLRLPFPCAVKTGTSKDFRDNWAVGYTPSYTVGVWGGNFNGEPMHTVSGVTGCGTLFRDIMLRLHRENPPQSFRQPENLIRLRICPESGLRASVSCPGFMEEIFIPGTEPKGTCRRHSPSVQTGSLSRFPETDRIRIVNPSHGNIYQIDPVLKRGYQTISLEAFVPLETEILSFEWLADGEILAASSRNFKFRWNLQPGLHTLGFRAETKAGMVKDTVTVTVLD
ncbi:MAG: penicillin-binding protein 1C [Candidatus Aminicenantes bacterium]